MATSTRDSGTDLPLDELRSLSPVAGWYLTTVYRLGHDTEGTVSTGTLADRLDVSPSSVSEMVTRLSDEHFLSYARYEGVELTRRGRAVAESLARRQCVVASYFEQVLSYSIDSHTAYRIGQLLSPDAMAHLERAIPDASKPSTATESYGQRRLP